jgi:hypothetical protein
MLAILTLFILINVSKSFIRNPCENIIDNYEEYYWSRRNDIVCWENIYNRLRDNSKYEYDNICVYAFEKHICNMIHYNNENYGNLPKKWCSDEYENARNTYENKCTLGYFELVLEGGEPGRNDGREDRE